MSKWIGKTVQVVKPEVLLRVGYPKALADYLPAAKEDWEGDLGKLLGGLWRYGPEKSKAKILRELAYMRARADGFGGGHRTLHVLDHEALRGHVFEVVGARRVWTGVRSAGGGYGDDYEPPALCDQQAHVILSLQRLCKWQFEAYDAVHALQQRAEFQGATRPLGGEFEIALANVQLADADEVYGKRAKAQEPPEDREWDSFF